MGRVRVQTHLDRSMVRTSDFKSENLGSIPSRGAFSYHSITSSLSRSCWQAEQSDPPRFELPIYIFLSSPINNLIIHLPSRCMCFCRSCSVYTPTPTRSTCFFLQAMLRVQNMALCVGTASITGHWVWYICLNCG